ncbi:DUF4143 domain-containing protein [Desulfomicrobium norvegicum]|uniref:DUF4143 domain-containing protein n=1 Tax=Desulfomicrobium norvegicum (strain DSM 1741 / NCIMB 8310) TaxID=52561 RepID=UPI001ABF78A3|nr:DUF4143 domain-containing protein [Desulfomicrobium norvegicum]
MQFQTPTPWPRRNSPEESPRSSYPHCCKGLACALLGLGADALWKDRVVIGRILATFICLELKHQADWLDDAVSFRHFRDKDKMEVDLRGEDRRGRDEGVIDRDRR